MSRSCTWSHPAGHIEARHQSLAALGKELPHPQDSSERFRLGDDNQVKIIFVIIQVSLFRCFPSFPFKVQRSDLVSVSPWRGLFLRTYSCCCIAGFRCVFAIFLQSSIASILNSSPSSHSLFSVLYEVLFFLLLCLLYQFCVLIFLIPSTSFLCCSCSCIGYVCQLLLQE